MRPDLQRLNEDDIEDGKDETKRIDLAGARSISSRFRLVVMMGERGNAAFPLPVAGELTIGRATGCDIRIDDAKLSRRHAVLRMGSKIEVIDLGSANGTQIGGRALSANEPVVVAPGEIIVFGDTIAIVQNASAGTSSRHVFTHSHFEARLEDECVRAGKNGAFAVVRMRLNEQQRHLVEPTFEKWMRPMDMVASYSPDEWEFLLIDVGPEEVAQIVGSLRAHVEPLMGPVVFGVASYPAAGRTPEKLISAAGRFHVPDSTGVRVQVGFLERLRPLMERVAAGTISVLVTGETGAGKEVLAHALHRLSPRASSPMVCINCAAISETLLESELFGHERGAFTGATQAKPGLLETANGGTVFLDEIGEMPASLQAKLLRVIQEREVQRVGGLKPRSIDVRFVSATNRDLEADVLRGTFRQDLFYRLNGVVLAVPPLRERQDEIEPLALAFIAECAKQLAAREPRLSKHVLALFQSYAWPGNVRELRNVIERAVLLSTGDEISLEHVPHERMKAPVIDVRAVITETSIAVPLAPDTPRWGGGDMPTLTGIRLPIPTASLGANDPEERARIVAVLEQCAGNQTHAAKVLGVSRNTLIARLNQYDLARPRKRTE